MAKYMGVTIGPIFDTINQASSPAALWVGSYLFSYLTKTICRLLVESNIPEEDILVPYYSQTKQFDADNEGVGLFHDRVVFRADNYNVKDFAKIREDAIDHLAQTFQVDKEYLEEYLLIAVAMCEVEHPILDTGKIMESLELSKPIVQGRAQNPLLSLFVGKEHYGNENIKGLPLTKGFTNWPLRTTSGSLKTISDLAGVGLQSGMKKHQYYAILRSDGDRIGSIIQSLTPDEIRGFSKSCIGYCTAVAKAVREYGGVAIYSGGDDLLAIMPCENQRGEVIFEFIQRANQLFITSFKEYGVKVSLSFGVTICYHKFPLYEALEDSQHLLFDVAKDKRDCTAIHLQKHAGQSECLVIPNAALESFIKFFKTTVEKSDGEWLHSIHHKLCAARCLCMAAGSEWTQIKNLFVNLFDAHSHKGNTYVHEVLPRFFYDLKTTLNICSIDDQKNSDDIDTLCYILRILRFYTEKGGKDE